MSNKIYGITLKDDGKVYFFNGGDFGFKKGDLVVVETENGNQFGKVVSNLSQNSVSIPIEEMKKILRTATSKDIDDYNKNIADSEKCLNKARESAKELDLSMNILDANYSLDKKQLLFNFVAEERVDFRELAKRLAALYKTRIELRQIGARDKARSVCGIGQCGRKICCSSFLNHIDSITMNMAKNQNIALNPSKINGACGRLLCCLSYEDDTYTRCRKNLPEVGSNIKYEGKDALVTAINIFKQTYTININGEEKEIQINEK